MKGLPNAMEIKLKIGILFKTAGKNLRSKMPYEEFGQMWISSYLRLNTVTYMILIMNMRVLN